MPDRMIKCMEWVVDFGKGLHSKMMQKPPVEVKSTNKGEYTSFLEGSKERKLVMQFICHTSSLHLLFLDGNWF